MHTAVFTDFSAPDHLSRFSIAMKWLREHPGSTLVVPPGRYVVTSELARRTMHDAIHGVYGENPEKTMFHRDFAFTTALDFTGQRNTTLEATGASLVIGGFMQPIALQNCENVTIRGLAIDHARKPFSMGYVKKHRKDAAGEWIEVRFDDNTKVTPDTIMPRMCAYDQSACRFIIGFGAERREYIDRQRMRITLRRPPKEDLTGMELYIWHSFHYRPAILMENAKNIRLDHVTIHSQPGMGIVGHRTENIAMDHLQVVPSAGYHMSTNTDATHFTSCRGDLVFSNCRFTGHGDDATNVHTFYHNLEIGQDRRHVRTRVTVPTHSVSLDYADAGDEMELTDQQSLSLVSRFRVMESHPNHEEGYCDLLLDNPLPEGAERCFLSDVSQMPRLRFKGCETSNHWARSVLIKTRDAAVEDCVFRCSALWSIHIAAEGSWHEGVAPARVSVRNNRFEGCGFMDQAAVGGVCVEMSSAAPAGTPIREILIENNRFDLPLCQHAVSLRNVDGAILRGNSFLHLKGQPVAMTDCANITIENNY